MPDATDILSSYSRINKDLFFFVILYFTLRFKFLICKMKKRIFISESDDSYVRSFIALTAAFVHLIRGVVDLLCLPPEQSTSRPSPWCRLLTTLFLGRAFGGC